MNIELGYQFLKLNITEGVITNITDTDDVVEIAIIDEGTESDNLKEGSVDNIYLERLDRCLFNTIRGKTVYGRINTSHKGKINFLQVDVDGTNLELTDFYTKVVVDKKLALKSDLTYVEENIQTVKQLILSESTKNKEQDRLILEKVDNSVYMQKIEELERRIQALENPVKF